MLHFEMKPPLSHIEFLDSCQRLVSPKDFQMIQNARLDYDCEEPSYDAVFNNWAKFNREFRSEQAGFRAQKAGEAPRDYMRSTRASEVSVMEIIEEASKSPDPLTGEKILDRFKWQRLDELTQGRLFDVGFLIAYGLKLQILERYQQIASSRGKEIFGEYIRNIELDFFEGEKYLSLGKFS